jgi:hypothetical protein
MFQFFVFATSGIAAGSLHVLSGPDHLAAVAPLVTQSARRFWRAGFAWALGHSAGVLLVGAAALLLRDVFPLAHVSSISERAVGAGLIAVGVWGLWRAAGLRVHTYAHAHGGSVHAHVHVHGGVAAAQACETTPKHEHMPMSFSFGIVHGLAGSSHVFGILPALALPTTAGATAFLGGFGLGTVLAMTLFASALGVVSRRVRMRGLRVFRTLLYACSGAAIIVGGTWLAL